MKSTFGKQNNLFQLKATSEFLFNRNGIGNTLTTIEETNPGILKQKNINSVQAKRVTGNITPAQAKSYTKTTGNNEYVKRTGKASHDVMWDWNITAGLIYIGDGFEELFGYPIHNHTMNFADFCCLLVPEERYAVEKKLLRTLASDEKTWNECYTIKRNDGSVVSTASRAMVIRNKKGKAINLTGTITDLNKQEALEKKLQEQITIYERENEKFFVAAKLSFDVVLDWNTLTDEMFIGDGFEELFGYTIKNNKGSITDWNSHLHPDDREKVEKELQAAIESSDTYWQGAYRFIRADGSVANVFDRVSIIRHADGKAYRVIGAMQDISRQKELEEKLEQEIKLKEQQIAEATEDAKGAERSDIGKELHDNINQLLGASKMYIEMAKRGGKDSGMYLSRSSEYTLTAIEEIRRLSKGLTTDTIKNFGLGIAVENLARDMMEVNPIKIYCKVKSFEEHKINDKFKKNIFRIVQEQLNNTLKHAKATEVNINLSEDAENIKLIISDNGVGFDTAKKGKGIGIYNIISRAASHRGTANFVSQPNRGCVLTVIIPVSS